MKVDLFFEYWPMLKKYRFTREQIKRVNDSKCLYCTKLSKDWISIDSFYPECLLTGKRIYPLDGCSEFVHNRNAPPLVVLATGEIITMPEYRTLLTSDHD